MIFTFQRDIFIVKKFVHFVDFTKVGFLIIHDSLV